MAKAEYRSSIRSKNLIKHAFAKLLQKKEISKITVTDIIQTADISRGTFYAHYSDVYSVLDQIIAEEMNQLISAVRETGIDSFRANPQKLIHRIFVHLESDFDYYGYLLNNDEVSSVFMKRLSEVFKERSVEETAKLPNMMSEDKAKVFLIFVVNGFRVAITNWLSGSVKLSGDELSEYLIELICSAKEFCLVPVSEEQIQ